MVKKAVLHLFILTLTVFFSCDRKAERPALSVSVEPQRYLLERIVGDKWNVNSVLGKGSDPESFDPSLNVVRQLMESDVYFLSGNIPFEDKLRRRIDEEGGHVMIVDSSNGIDLIKGTHHHEHGEDADEHIGESDSFDPHVWGSVKNAMIISDNMLEVMLEIDPQNAEYYKDNHSKLKAELKRMDGDFRNSLADKKGSSFIVWHPSLSYFSRDYALNQIALDVENKEISANEFKAKIDSARVAGVNLFFVQPEYDESRSAEIARQIGARVVNVNLLDYNWPEEMNKVANAISGQ